MTEIYRCDMCAAEGDIDSIYARIELLDYSNAILHLCYKCKKQLVEYLKNHGE